MFELDIDWDSGRGRREAGVEGEGFSGAEKVGVLGTHVINVLMS